MSDQALAGIEELTAWSVGDIVNALASADQSRAVEGVREAAGRWAETGDALIDSLAALADGTDCSDRNEWIGPRVIYLAAQMRDPRAHGLICKLGARDDALERLIGDGLTEDLAAILARTYPGDPAPLRRLIEAPNADPFVRYAALEALAWLTATGRLLREDTAAYLRTLHDTLQPQDDSEVWVGWQAAISSLAMTDLVPLVEDAFLKGWIPDFIMEFKHFREDLQKALQATKPSEAFEPWIGDDSRLDDAAAYMAGWTPPADESDDEDLLAAASYRNLEQPYRNPFRNVGRNDPCPCGSGKKFKKCCLVA